MIAISIVVIALWSCPIISFLVFLLTKNKPVIRKNILLVSIIIAAMTALALLINISTTCSMFDWLAISFIYLTICLMLMWLIFQKRVLRIAGLFMMVVVFGFGYIMSTVGLLGTMFVIGEYDTDREVWLEDGLILKEMSSGTAFSDHRGKRVEIYRTIPWLPIIELKKQEKYYDGIIVCANPLTVNYKPIENKIYLSASMTWGEGSDAETRYWSEILELK